MVSHCQVRHERTGLSFCSMILHLEIQEPTFAFSNAFPPLCLMWYLPSLVVSAKSQTSNVQFFIPCINNASSIAIFSEERPERPEDPWAPSDNIHTHSSVVITPANIRVDEGSQVILECHSQGNSRIISTKTDGPLPAGVSPYENQLVLTNVRPEDAGQYVCTATDSPAPNQGSSQITVTGGRGKKSNIHAINSIIEI